MGDTIRLSELTGKNIVNIYDGVRLGTVQESDMTFHTETGMIEAMVVPNRSGLAGLWLDKGGLHIPWQAVNKIGREVIIVDLGQSPMKFKRGMF